MMFDLTVLLEQATATRGLWDSALVARYTTLALGLAMIASTVLATSLAFPVGAAPPGLLQGGP